MTDITLLPPNATAMERAMSRLGANLTAISVPIRDMLNPWACPEHLLPWLAYAFRVDDWDDSWDANVKRQVIASSIEIKRAKGTIGAVQQAVAALGVTGTVQEWYQQIPAAAPYTFRLHLDARQSGYTQAQLKRLSQVVDRAKNTRSHLDRVVPSVTSDSRLRVAAFATTGNDITVSDGTPRYSDGGMALDLLIDAAVFGEAESTLPAVNSILHLSLIHI